MTESMKLIEKMIDLGISEKDARIYSVLLQKRELTALEIQKTAHVPRTKVYEITQRMISNNMCIEKHIRGKKKFQAVEPEKFFHNYLSQQEHKLESQRKLVKEIEKMATHLHSRGMRTTDICMSVEVITDQLSIYERYVSLVKYTKKELLGFVKPPYIHQYNDKKLDEQDDILFRRTKKRVQVRILYEMPDQKIGWLYNYIKKCAKRGEKARIADHVPAKLYIFDEQKIMLLLPNTSHKTSLFTMFVMNHPSLAQAGKILFNHLWQQARDYHVLESLIKSSVKKGNSV